jgi:hypothetical protein
VIPSRRPNFLRGPGSPSLKPSATPEAPTAVVPAEVVEATKGQDSFGLVVIDPSAPVASRGGEDVYTQAVVGEEGKSKGWGRWGDKSSQGPPPPPSPLLRPEDAELIHSVLGPEVPSCERIATLLRDGLVSEEAAALMTESLRRVTEFIEVRPSPTDSANGKC